MCIYTVSHLFAMLRPTYLHIVVLCRVLCLQVKRFQAHKGPVNDLCFDETAEFVGSCSDDGGAMVHCHHHLVPSNINVTKAVMLC